MLHGRRAHLVVGRLRAAVADVLAHRAGEEERLLRHQPDVPAILGQVQAADVPPVDQKLPALELVEAGDQLGDAALARAGVAHQRQRLFGPDRRAKNRAARFPSPV